MSSKDRIGAAFLSLVILAFGSYSYFHLPISKQELLSQAASAADGLVAHYTFDDTLNGGGITGTTNYVSGKVGKALSFDGAVTAVSYPDVLGTGPLTISAWVNPNSHGEQNAGRIIGNGKTALLLATTNRFYFTNNGSTVASVPNSTVPFSTWTFVTVTRDAQGTVNLYVNGQKSGTANQSAGALTAGTTNLIVGNTGAGDRAFDGLIDDVRVYSKVLDDSQIAALFTEGGGVVAPPTQPTTPTDPTPPPPPVIPDTVTSVRTPATSMPPYVPVVGIPTPSFGLTETHFMYQLQSGETCSTHPAKCFDYGAGLEPYRDNGAGPYTHYIDNTHPNATDTSNPFGIPNRPRKTWPWNLPVGSVVEVHGGPYDFGNGGISSLAGVITLYGQGTKARPIFLRGPSAASKPRILDHMFVLGNHVIIENLNFFKKGIKLYQRFLQQDIRGVVMRNLDMYGDGTELGNGVAIEVGPWKEHNVAKILDTVIYKNDMHTYGNVYSAVENDQGGVIVNGYEVENVWILDNEMHSFGGDSIRTGNNEGGTPLFTAKNTYIGRNNMYNNRENAVDVKATENVVISQNKMYGFVRSSSSGGDAVSVHYYPKGIWIIFNEISDAVSGVKASSGLVDMYLIGNIIKNVEYGATWWSTTNISFLGNIIANAKHGFYNGGQMTVDHPIVNNIFYNISDYAIRYNYSGLADASTVSNNLFYNTSGAGMKFIWKNQPGLNSLEAFQAYSGKCGGCIAADLKFVNPGMGDFRPQSDSPAINTGSDTLATTLANKFYSAFGVDIRKDFLGVSRPQNNAWDIGPYEYAGAVSNPPPTSPIMGDITGDGKVNTFDFSEMNRVWNTSDSRCDLNKDGMVNTLDYSILVRNWTG